MHATCIYWHRNKTKVEETLLGCNDMQPIIDLPTFKMYVLHSPSGSKGNRLLVACLLELLFDLEDGYNRYFRNVCHLLSYCRVSHPRA
jgi:hypothetical protein